MYVIAVTIGRNVPVTDPTLPQYDAVTGVRLTEPMTDARWADFIESVKRDVIEALDGNRYGVIEVSEGMGEWGGVTEPNATITVRRHTQAQDSQLERLRRYLSEDARHFDQDAIALTIGISELC